MQLSRGQYRFTPKVDSIKEDVFCGVCGQKTILKPNVFGPLSSVDAMAGIKSNYDEFVCFDHAKDWHKQAKALMKLSGETPSKTLAEIYEQEIKECIGKRQCTKQID